jgi:hypothetical protein
MNRSKLKLSNLETDQRSNWKLKTEYRRENRDWLKKSAGIALKVLEALRDHQLSQKDLAQRMSIFPQQINKIVKGQENFFFNYRENNLQIPHSNVLAR